MTADVLAMAKPYETQWPQPDMAVMTGYQTDPPELHLQVFGSLAKWIQGAAELKSCPPDYVAGVLLAVAAGTIGNSLAVSPWDGWTEPCVLWLANVGLPSSNKSPAVDAVLDPIIELESALQREYHERIKDFETEVERAKAAREAWEKDLRDAQKRNQPEPPKPEKAFDPEHPANPRLRVADATIEALSAILLENPRGVINIQDELAGWLENQNRYSGTGSDRPFWLQAFGARSYVVDRVKNRGKRGFVPRLSISVCGGIQPELLDKALLSGADDGLSGRFLFIWPKPVPPRRPQSKEDKITIDRIIQRLYSLKLNTNDYGEPKPRVVMLDDLAAADFDKYRQHLYEVEQSSHGLMLSHIGKMPGITLRLALILEMLWWANSTETNPPITVSQAALTTACGLVEGYFLPMAKRTFGSAALPESDKYAVALAKWIFKERPTMVNASQLRRHRVVGLKTAELATTVVLELVEAGWLVPKPSRDGGTPGRQKQDFLVNPRIWESK